MKYVGSAEFKANRLRLMAEVQAGGEPITVTKRGKPVTVVGRPPSADHPKPFLSAFGLSKSDAYRNAYRGVEPEDFVVDSDWEAKWDAKWDERLAPAAKP